MSNVVYTPTFDELEFARDWHDGQGSMLYAIASTGALSRGTIRPMMTDDEWSAYLMHRLQIELRSLAEYVESDHDRQVRDDWVDNLNALMQTLDDKIDAAEKES